MSEVKSTATPLITVYGDIILDAYINVSLVKSSPESSGNVYAVGDTTWRLGGAGATATIVSSLGARVRLVGPIGSDAAGDRVGKLVAASGSDACLDRCAGRITPTKFRHVLEGRLLPDRFDSEKFKLYAPQMFQCGRMLVISDYNKGACIVAHRLISYATFEQVCRVIVDPAFGVDWQQYKGATIIKPNYREAIAAARIAGLSNAVSHTPPQIAEYLAIKYNCVVIMTNGAEGFYIADANGYIGNEPAVRADLVDVTGAGDTVAAVLAVELYDCQLTQYNLKRACGKASLDAAKQIQSIGVQSLKSVCST